MSDYKVTDTELTNVANAIRTKGGTQALMEWPAGFISAINAIDTGGGEDINDYQIVEYIQSSSTNVAIPVGMSILDITAYEVDMQLNALESVNIYFGSSVIGFGHRENGSKLYTTNGNGYKASNVAASTSRRIIRWNIAGGNSVDFSIDGGSSVAIALSRRKDQSTVAYLCSSDPSNSGTGMNGKLYGAKIYGSKGSIVRELKPCYKKADNTVGLFDVVSNTFYSNVGNGSLTAGPDVNS